MSKDQKKKISRIMRVTLDEDEFEKFDKRDREQDYETV